MQRDDQKKATFLERLKLIFAIVIVLITILVVLVVVILVVPQAKLTEENITIPDFVKTNNTEGKKSSNYFKVHVDIFALSTHLQKVEFSSSKQGPWITISIFFHIFVFFWFFCPWWISKTCDCTNWCFKRYVNHFIYLNLQVVQARSSAT